MTPEGKVKERIKTILTAHGAWFCMPFGSIYGRAGIPDFIVCHRGRFLGVEAKAGHGKATALQVFEMDKITAAGGHAMIVNERNLEELEGWLRDQEKSCILKRKTGS